MAAGYSYVPRRALSAAGVAFLLGSVGILSACTNSQATRTTSSVRASVPTTMDAAAAKAAVDRAATQQSAAVKAAGQKYVAAQKSGEAAAAKAHTLAKAAAACGVPVGYIQITPKGSRIGMPDVPKRGDMWHVEKTSPIKPGMIIYWPDGGPVLCR